MLPESDRLRHKVYLKDELRMRLIERVYVETQERSPDEAPIWDQYETSAYAPAEIRGRSPLTVLYAVGDHAGEAREAFDTLSSRLPDLARRKRVSARERLRLGAVVTGRPDVDRAYAQVLTRFNDCLVARDVKIHGAGGEHRHFNAIFAGNKYFLDAWKRDENVSLIGLLATGDFETVRVILADTWRYQDPRTGRLPHILRVGEPLVYYSSDGTLWALERLHRYTRMSGDRTLLDQKYPMVEHFFAASLEFVRRGLLPSGGIIDKSYLWETWMDTPYTPRDGYPVEIELLWLTVLEAFLPFVEERNPALASRLRATLEEGRETFALFYLDGYLADSLSYAWEPRDWLTPNGHIAFGLNFPLPADLGKHMVTLGREQLAGRVGIRSLAPRDWATVFPPEFLHDPDNIRGDDMVSVGIYNYHRGIEWLWLNQFFVAGELRYGDAATAYRTYLHGQVHAALNESGVGGLGELHDAHGSLGADFQAWSMAGFVASLHEFIGVEVDAPARRLRALPSTPDEWTEIDARCRVADTRFEVRCKADGASRQIEIIPDDLGLDGYSLELGVRFRSDPEHVQLELQGSRIPNDRLRIDRNGQKIWIDTEISGKTVMTFRELK
jgi:glycogen debranching enzyme